MVLDPLGGAPQRPTRLPKVVFSDLDDTFLTHDKRITDENMALLDTFLQHGIEFVPCTGRPASGVPEVLREHPCVHYTVSSNGSIVTDAKTGEVVGSWLMDVDCVRRMYDKVKDFDVTFDVFVEGQAYTERARYERLHEFMVPAPQVAFLRSNRIQVDCTIPELLDSFVNRPEGLAGVERMSTHYKTQEIHDAVCALVDEDPQIHWASSGRSNIEINRVDASKGNALVWVCERLGIDVADSMAFGDNLNDASMLRAAGCGVCVENGTDEAKAAADVITLSCDESGVAALINKLL